MASVTAAQAVLNIESFYKQFLPSYVAKLPNDSFQYAVELFNMKMAAGSSLKASYDFVIAQAVVLANGFEHAYPSNPVPSASEAVNPIAFANRISGTEVVDYFYKSATAAEKSVLVDAINKGTLSVTDFASAISVVGLNNAHPTPSQIINAPSNLTGSGDLPHSGLSFAGLTSGQQDFLASMYIGAFGRAPEYEGLKYWASELTRDIQQGHVQNDAYLMVGNNMYKAGAQNGEGGTQLQNSEYIGYAYTNALGRQPDAAGFAYWENNLNSGAIQRGEFLTTFLTAGMGSERDSAFLVSRVAVGEFAAQKHVTGPGAPGIDLKGVIAPVHDVSSAQTAISGILAQYGAGQIELVGVNSTFSFA